MRELVSLLDVAESWLGIIVASGCVLAIPIGILGYLWGGASLSMPLTALTYAACAVGFSTGAIFIWIGMRCAWEKQYPIAIALALQYPVFPSIVRPLLSVWWALQACLSITGIVNSRLSNPQSNELVTAIVSLVFLYACNSFLLLSISVWCRTPRGLAKAWKWRHVLNVAAATAIVAFV